MRQTLRAGLILALLSTTTLRADYNDEEIIYCAPPKVYHDRDNRYVTREATVFSMMGWGFGLAIAIAVICGVMDQNNAP